MRTAAADTGRSTAAHNGKVEILPTCSGLIAFDEGPRWFTIVSPIFTADMLPPSVPLAAAARNFCLASVGEL